MSIPTRVRPRLSRPIAVLASVVLAASISTVQASSASAAGTPSGPQYTYRMVSVSLTSSRYKAEALGTIQCVQNTGSVSFSTSVTSTNSFSYTAGLGFSTLKGLLDANISVSGGVTTSTTTQESVTMNLNAGQCARVHALRNAYSYTLQRKCNYACTTATGAGVFKTLGTGSYTKVVGRGYFLV